MTRPEFWDEMARQRPGLFEKVSSWVIAALDKFLGRYKGYQRHSERAFTDLQKVREIVADVVGRYTERTLRSETLPDSSMSAGFATDTASVETVFNAAEAAKVC